MKLKQGTKIIVFFGLWYLAWIIFCWWAFTEHGVYLGPELGPELEHAPKLPLTP